MTMSISTILYMPKPGREQATNKNAYEMIVSSTCKALSKGLRHKRETTYASSQYSTARSLASDSITVVLYLTRYWKFMGDSYSSISSPLATLEPRPFEKCLFKISNLWTRPLEKIE